MFLKYLSRELVQRKRQTILVSIALAVAIALVVVVNAASVGINSAQSKVLSGLYGIGTDITVSQTAIPTQGGQRFDFQGGGQGQPRQRPDFSTFSQDRLDVARFSGTFQSITLADVKKLAGISGASATLKLNSISFNGSIPTSSTVTAPNSSTDNSAPSASGGAITMPSGGGRGNFEITSKSIEGIDVTGSNVGPLSGVDVASGRTFATTDSNTNVALVDATYAKANSIAVGGNVTIKSVKFQVIGIVAANSGSAETSSNIYIPLDTAQNLAGKTGLVTNFYVSSKSSSNIASLKKELAKIYPGATVSSQSDLAATLSGSLNSASSLVKTLGKWLSIIVLLVAFAFAGLFTSSGITRRIREFGTLKAIGWRNSRITKQIMGETLATSAIGALLGLIFGIVGVFVVNLFAPTLNSTVAAVNPFGNRNPGGFGGGRPGGFPGGPGRFPGSASAESIVKLHLGLSTSALLIAIGIALLGGLFAGTMGALRASKLTPASALRSVA